MAGRMLLSLLSFEQFKVAHNKVDQQLSKDRLNFTELLTD